MTHNDAFTAIGGRWRTARFRTSVGHEKGTDRRGAGRLGHLIVLIEESGCGGSIRDLPCRGDPGTAAPDGRIIATLQLASPFVLVGLRRVDGVEHPLRKRGVGGSNPFWGTTPHLTVEREPETDRPLV